MGADASGWISSGRPVFFSGKEETRPELRAMLREEVTECWQKEKKQCELHLLFYGFITITLA